MPPRPCRATSWLPRLAIGGSGIAGTGRRSSLVSSRSAIQCGRAHHADGAAGADPQPESLVKANSLRVAPGNVEKRALGTGVDASPNGPDEPCGKSLIAVARVAELGPWRTVLSVPQPKRHVRRHPMCSRR